MCVKKDNLSSSIRSGDGEKYGDIYSLIMEITGCTFGQANKKLHNLFGLEYQYKSKDKIKKTIDPLSIFKKVKRRKYIVNQDLPVYSEDIIREYSPLPHIDWIKDGIVPKAFKRFNIGYSFDRKRIVIPERKWDGEEDDYIGIMGRTTLPNAELFDIPKYYPLKKYPKGLNVYGLNENYKSIQESGYCVVFEAAKSVLKRYSRKDETGVAIGGSTITDEQARILIGLNIDIVVALDEGIPIEHVWQQCDKFYGLRNIFFIYDQHGLLKNKESPADKPNKIYNYLFKYKKQYGDMEREKLQVWQEKQMKN